MSLKRAVVRRLLPVVAIATIAFALSDAAAFAQFAHHPFAVGANEGAVGRQNAFGAWVLAKESYFYLQLTGAVKATKMNPAATLLLMAISFGYGIFHAAGPGHGKAVITSYMVSNEVALRRGLVIAGLAAIVQGFVATALIGTAAFLFNASAQRMTDSAQAIELASYIGIIGLGLVMVWRKGQALVATLRVAPAPAGFALAGGSPGFSRLALEESTAALSTVKLGRSTAGYNAVSRFVADDGTLEHDADCDCGRSHMPDPRLLAGPRLDLRTAAYAVMLAGARPCSGAMLVLVFAYAQGVFIVGVLATFAMAAGTAVTTGALAALAVFAKDVAVRFAGSRRSTVTLRLVECAAALAILVFGIALFGAAFLRVA